MARSGFMSYANGSFLEFPLLDFILKKGDNIIMISLKLCYKMDAQSVYNSTFDENSDAIRSFFLKKLIA